MDGSHIATEWDALLARRAAREPLAYILGHQEFWSLRFEVSPATLIPRPDSETLIEAALASFPDRAGVRRVVYTSFAAPAPDATFTFARTHYATEQAIERAGLEYTFLRDNFYLDVFPDFVSADRVLRGA